MSNKYLEKIAKLSEENKQVAKTFATQTAVGLPAHLLGGLAGAKLLTKPIEKGLSKLSPRLAAAGKAGTWLSKQVGTNGASGLAAIVGSQVAGGLGDLAALKHSLKKGKGEQ